MKFQRYLTEMSYKESDIPKHFRVVFDLKSKIKSLLSHKLDHVTGISDNKEISIDFLGTARDAMLVMDSRELISLNKLSRIMYDNPKYLMQDNMAGLRRLFNDRSEPSSSFYLNQTLHNLFEYAFRQYWKKTKPNIAHDIEYMAGWQTLAYHYRDNRKKFNSPKDAAKWAKKAAEVFVEEKSNTSFYWKTAAALSVKEWEDAIVGGLKIAGQLYKGEGEWIVKDNVLKIPKKSRLFVLFSQSDVQKDPKFHYIPADLREMVKKYNLDKKYRIFYIDPKKWNEIRKRHWKKRD